MRDLLTIQIRPSGEAVVVHLAGELDLASAAALAEALDSALRHGRDVVVDLAQLDFMDCSGLHVLLDAAARAGAAGTSVAIVGARPGVQRLLLLTGATRTLRVLGRPLGAAA